MILNGKGIAKGMWVTLRRFTTAVTVDVRHAGRRYLTDGQELTGDLLLERQGPQSKGVFTVQKPKKRVVHLAASAPKSARRNVSGLCVVRIRRRGAPNLSRRSFS